MTDVMLEHAQGRKPRLLDMNSGVRERDGFDQSSLGTDTIKRKGRQKIVESEWFAVASQMKENRVRGCDVQVALLRSPLNQGGLFWKDVLTAFTEERIRSSGNRSDSRSKAS